MPSVDARGVVPDDYELVYDIKCAAMRPYVEATWGWDEEEQRRLHERRFHVGETEILLVDGAGVGVRYVRREADEIVLVSLLLHPDWQSQGIGSSILRSLMDEADEAGLPLRLRVLRANERARAFYERHGFRITETTDTHHHMSSR